MGGHLRRCSPRGLGPARLARSNSIHAVGRLIVETSWAICSFPAHTCEQGRTQSAASPLLGRHTRGLGLDWGPRGALQEPAPDLGGPSPAPDLVDRNFTADRPNQLWVADITYIPTAAGFLYLAVVLDAFSRRIVGWAMETHLRTELVLAALEMAIGQRKPSNVIHHSDQGSQYTSLAFGGRCREAGVLPSMGSVGDAYDNAMCESFFATLECELLARRRFTSQAEARMAVFSYIEGWYNPARRHSGIRYLSPIAYETQVLKEPKRPK